MTRTAVNIALALSLLVPTPATARELREVDASMTPRELCDNLLQLSLRKLRPTTGPVDHSNLHAGLQKDFPPVEGRPSVSITALIGGGMGAYGPAGLESVVAWRDDAGRWHARRAEEASGGRAMDPELPLAPLWPDPNPKPLVEGHVREPGSLQLSSGPLSPQQGALLDKALLAESCINVEPPVFPASLPLRRGGSVPCVPDSAWRHIEVRQGENVRRFVRPCQSLGAIGLIGRTLDGLALPSAPVVRNRADLYNGTESPTAASLRDFLTARLPGVRYRDAKGEATVTAIRHVAPCVSKIDLSEADGKQREVEFRWIGTEPRSYPAWISDGVVGLGKDGSDPSWIAPGSTLALQLQGTLFHMHVVCRS